MKNAYPFYTIGHAARETEEFVALLKSQDVTMLVDVRSVPRSLKNPQYNESVLPGQLSLFGIGYLRIPALGGFRAKSKTVPPETNAFWRHNSFHSYADYAMTDAFREGLDILLELGKEQAAAVMCAELLWWRCHRRIITDYLISCGQEVYHIIGKDNVIPAKLSGNARLAPTGALTYPIKADNITTI